MSSPLAQVKAMLKSVFTSSKKSDAMPHDCLPQLQSPLFKLPPELRYLIWQFALQRYVDSTEIWDKSKTYYRPNYEGPKQLTVGLLQSCQRIYSEALPIARQQNHRMVWFDYGRAPWPMMGLYVEGVKRTPGLQLELCCQLYYVSGLSNFFADHLPALNPRHLTLTIRHTDWWWWEDDHDLFLDESVEDEFWFPTSVRTFVLRLETLMRKKKQLDGVVDDVVKHRVFKNTLGERFDVVRKHPTTWTWQGEYPPGSPAIDQNSNSIAEYYVIDVEFNQKGGESSSMR